MPNVATLAEARIDGARLLEVVEVKFIKGAGVPGDPIRQVVQYWSREGELLAERDTAERNLADGQGAGYAIEVTYPRR